MNEDKIKELFSNEEFVKDLLESESYEVAQNKLADKDIELSVDELKKIVGLIKKKENGELSDEELEDVAGGTGLGILIGIGVIGTLAIVSGGYSLLRDSC